MRRLLKKYLIVAIVTIVAVKLLTAIIMNISPSLLTTQLENGSKHILGIGFLSKTIEYLFNIVIIYLLYNDMKREKVINIPILILTFFSNLLGIIFFFLMIAYNELITKKQSI